MQFLAVATALALLCGSSIATPVEKRCTGYGYGTFYTDNACTENPSVAFSMDNSGCLANEYDRNSIYIQAACGNTGNGGPSLVWSPGNECNCQNHCAGVPSGDSSSGNICWDLNGNPDATSFRFIEQGCGPNNC